MSEVISCVVFSQNVAITSVIYHMPLTVPIASINVNIPTINVQSLIHIDNFHLWPSHKTAKVFGGALSFSAALYFSVRLVKIFRTKR